MRRAPLEMSVVVAGVLIGVLACGKKPMTEGPSPDSTRTAGAAEAVPESTAVPSGNADGTGQEAQPDTLMLFSYAQRRGMRLYRHYCVVCHGDQGAGDGFNAYNLDPKPRDLTDPRYQGAISDDALKQIVTQGGRAMNRSILMPAYGQTLSSEQIADLVAYLRTLTGVGEATEAAGGEAGGTGSGPGPPG